MFLRRRHGPAAGGPDRGASALEYALLVAAVAIVVLGVVAGLASIVSDALRTTSSCVHGGGRSGCPTATVRPTASD
jgi:Flp pilus assembly pilin Flp